MSTPVNQLPNNKPSSTALPDDPDVLNVLQEMEQEVKTATKAAMQPQQMAMPPPPPQMVTAYPPSIQMKKAPTNRWIDYDIMKRAGIIAVLALVIFYPKTLESLYSSFPQLAILEKFDIGVRAFLLAVVVYVATIQFDI